MMIEFEGGPSVFLVLVWLFLRSQTFLIPRKESQTHLRAHPYFGVCFVFYLKNIYGASGL